MKERLGRTRGNKTRTFAVLALPLASLFALAAAAPEARAQVEVTIGAEDPAAAESPADDGAFVVRRGGGTLLVPLNIGYTVSGSATAGEDYAALSGSVTFGPFQSEVTIPVQVTGNDDIFEGDETVVVTLREASSVILVTRTATVTIADSPHAVGIADTADVTEDSGGTGSVTVTLGARNESGTDLAVDYAVEGTATPGEDYEALPGELVIPRGASQATIEIVPLPDDELELDENVVITLTGTGDPRVSIGDRAGGEVTIADDEARRDDDGDGIANLDECPDLEPCPDTDGDGIPDDLDDDDDGDGVPTASENPPAQDTDEDGTPDYLDDDDDGDGRLTRAEDADEDGDGNPATDPTDLDDDGVPDYLDFDDQGGPTGDLDGDGLTNEREEDLGTDPENPDSDGDGVNDGAEDAAGSDPLDQASFPDADEDLVPDPVEEAEGSDPNDAASFLDSDSGGTADYIETVLYPNRGLEPTDPADPADDRRDFDGDGLPDRLELSISGDPQDPDSPTASGGGDDDGDGVSNAVEHYLMTLGISPADELSDYDRDGYPDAAEIRLGLDPLTTADRDTDGDGVPDAVETPGGLDLDATTDTDGDGVPDARELAMGADPLDEHSPVANGGLDEDGDGVSNAVAHVLERLLGANATGDTDGDGIDDAEEIRLGTDPARDEQPSIWIELAQADVGAVNALAADAGAATATAMVGGHQTGTLHYDWSGSDNAVLAVTSGDRFAKTLTFSPETLPAGAYELLLRVHREVGEVQTAPSELHFAFEVLEDATAEDVADADGDGIPDYADEHDGRRGFANELPAHAGVLMQAEPGTRLRLGATARSVRSTSALVSPADIASVADGTAEDTFEYPGGIYDFEVANLPSPGTAVRVVLPQSAPIGEFAEYR